MTLFPCDGLGSVLAWLANRAACRALCCTWAAVASCGSTVSQSVLPAALQGRDITWVAGPGRVSDILGTALSTTSYDRIVIDSHLAVAVLVHELHDLTVCYEISRLERLRAFFAQNDDVAAAGGCECVLGVAGALLTEAPENLDEHARREYDAVVSGGSAMLAFVDRPIRVDWSSHRPTGLWAEPADPELARLWRCSRYVSVCLERMDIDSRTAFVGTLVRAGLTLKDFSGGVLGTVSAGTGGIALDSWSPDIRSLRALPKGMEPTARIARMAQECRGLEDETGPRAGMLRVVRTLSSALPVNSTWGFEPRTWRERRARAGAYLYVGLREADMAREPLVRGGKLRVLDVVVEPDKEMWKQFLELGAYLLRVGTEMELPNRGVTTHWLAEKCLALLDSENDRGSKSATEAQVIQKLLSDARWGDERGHVIMLEGDDVRVRRTPVYLVAVPWYAAVGDTKALAFGVAVEVVDDAAGGTGR